jgi:acetyl esterase/lipase
VFASLPEPLVAGFLRLVVRPVLGPPFPVRFQRAWMDVCAVLSPSPFGVRRRRTDLGGVPAVAFDATARTGTAQTGTSPTSATYPVVLYLHGGAFILGSDRTHAGLIGYLAEQLDGVVYALNYRLAPEHPWPAGQDDVLTAYRALLAQGIRPARMIVAGDSAGGVMVADLLLALAAEAKAVPDGGSTEGGGGELPAGGVLLSPAVGLDQDRPAGSGSRDTLVRRGWAKMAMNGYARPTADPANRILGRDLAGLPPLYLQFSEDELFAAENREFAEQLRAAGGRLELHVDAGAFHVLALLPTLMRRARVAIEQIAGFSRRSIDQARAR